MKIPEIKRLVTTHNLDSLEKAELALVQEETMPFEVHGEDDGEVLTHILAAKWILEDMENSGRALKDSLRAYSQKVRNSIS